MDPLTLLGGVAASGQLIGTGFSIIDSIAQLREFLKHAPAQFQGWRTQLIVLDEIISQIGQDSALQTCPIRRIVESISPKIEALTKLCYQYSPDPKLKFIRRLNKAISARSIESRILQNFESLERDKTALILTINAMRGSTSTTESPRQANTDIKDTMEKEQVPGTMQGMSGPPPSNSDYVRDQRVRKLGSQTNAQTSVPILPSQSTQCRGQDSTPGAASNPLDRTASQPSSTATTGVPTQAAPVRNIFKKIDVEGDYSSLADTTGEGATFDDVKIRGKGRRDGFYGPETTELFYASPIPQNNGVQVPTQAATPSPGSNETVP
ncbi:hypothetical protein F4677DRAFT_419604 [Hypoxylon crocopeplum]|nr:hypothetical protein F4677DRAFT_419604 [Hypoxylon crocopeplum]